MRVSTIVLNGVSRKQGTSVQVQPAGGMHFSVPQPDRCHELMQLAHQFLEAYEAGNCRAAQFHCARLAMLGRSVGHVTLAQRAWRLRSILPPESEDHHLLAQQLALFATEVEDYVADASMI
jgi:hypothetical protein